MRRLDWRLATLLAATAVASYLLGGYVRGQNCSPSVRLPASTAMPPLTSRHMWQQPPPHLAPISSASPPSTTKPRSVRQGSKSISTIAPPHTASAIAPPLTALVTSAALRRTLQHPLSTQTLRSMGSCAFKLVDGSLYRHVKCKPSKPNWQLITGLLVGAVASAHDDSPLPDFTVRLHQGANALPSGVPVLGWCAPEPGVLALPSPYEADCIYRHRYVFTLEHHRRRVASGLDSSPDAYPWRRRLPLAVWRGACTGKAGRREHRLRLATMARAHPAHLDVGLYPCGVCAELTSSEPSLFSNSSTGLAQADYARFKYVIDLDGDGCSGRLGKLLTSGAVVLKPWAAGYPFFYGALREWEHFVPVKADLSDLVKRIEWLQGHDDEAARIGRAASAFARELLSPSSIDAYVAAVLRGAATLAATERRAQDGALAGHTVGDRDGYELVYRRGGPREYSGRNLTDHKGRALDVTCPASAADAAHLTVSEPGELVTQYFESAAKALERQGRRFVGRQRRRGSSTPRM